MKKVQEAIQILIETKTFSLEGVKAIQEMRNAYEMLKKTYEAKREEYSSLSAKYGEQSSKLNKLVNDEANIRSREEAVTKREDKMTRLEIEKECADKMVGHTISMFNTVFRNATLQTSVMKNIVIPLEGNPGGNGQYPCSGFAYKETVTDITTNEVKD